MDFGEGVGTSKLFPFHSVKHLIGRLCLFQVQEEQGFLNKALIVNDKGTGHAGLGCCHRFPLARSPTDGCLYGAKLTNVKVLIPPRL